VYKIVIPCCFAKQLTAYHYIENNSV